MGSAVDQTQPALGRNVFLQGVPGISRAFCAGNGPNGALLLPGNGRAFSAGVAYKF